MQSSFKEKAGCQRNVKCRFRKRMWRGSDTCLTQPPRREKKPCFKLRNRITLSILLYNELRKL